MAMATEAPKSRATIEIPVERKRRKGPSRVQGLSRSTGPKTLQGKRKSRYNAVKHGIFADALLYDESRAEYENLLQGLMDHFQPIGQLEELLVEKLVMLWWRYRRLLQAEAARIRTQADSTERGSLREAVVQMTVAGDSNLLQMAFLTGNEHRLMDAISLFKRLMEAIEKDGLDWQRDRPVLKKLFGREPPQGLVISDWEKREAAENAEPERTSPLVKRYYELTHPGGEVEVSSHHGKKEMLGEVGEIVAALEPELKKWLIARDVSRLRRKTEALVPQGELGDRLLRYESSLERAIDRTLSQLERLQRLRTGQPVPPTLKVDVTRD